MHRYVDNDDRFSMGSPAVLRPTVYLPLQCDIRLLPRILPVVTLAPCILLFALTILLPYCRMSCDLTIIIKLLHPRMHSH